MKIRIISGLAMLPLLAVLYFGGYLLIGTCFVFSALALKEFFSGFNNVGTKPNLCIGYVSLSILYAIHIAAISTGLGEPAFMQLRLMWLFISVIICFLMLFDMEKSKPADSISTIFGIVYIVFFAYHMLLIDIEEGFDVFLWLVVFSAYGTDVFAYFTGIKLGKHKLAPNISPKKSIEGAIGGMMGSMLLCGIFSYFTSSDMMIDGIAIGFLGGIISQFGDLSASIFKRNMGIKDYGNLIPGHGGVLDRIDSLLFTAPSVYYYMVVRSLI